MQGSSNDLHAAAAATEPLGRIADLLAHLRIREHDKEFYKLCCHMEPAYHQLEFDARVWLYWQDSEATSTPATR